MRWAPHYQEVLSRCEPYVVSHRGNWAHLDLAPLGVEIEPHRRFEPTDLRSQPVLEGLHRLDRLTFGDQSMLMPRWVIFDCAAFPGLTIGFGMEARHLSPTLRGAYGVRDGHTFVPLSMWMALRCPEPGAWFGHNLSSANVVEAEAPLRGLGTLTKGLGLVAARATRQYGATQWGSGALPLHLRLGRDLKLLSSWTPAHTHPETLAYALEVDPRWLARLFGTAPPEHRRPPGARPVSASDRHALHGMQIELQAGADLRLVGVEGRGPDQTAWIAEGPALPG